jgi:hypothetical protein
MAQSLKDDRQEWHSPKSLINLGQQGSSEMRPQSMSCGGEAPRINHANFRDPDKCALRGFSRINATRTPFGNGCADSAAGGPDQGRPEADRILKLT